jgi:hypothetical protein
MDAVNSAEFVYALSPKVMKAFDGDVDDALDMFVVPAADVPVYGIEQVAVRVKGAESGDEEARVWEVDHQTVWCQYGVNAVQYQTSKSILLAISLLQQTPYGKLPLNCCASELPIGERDWEKIEQRMLELDIHWRDAAALLLHTKPYESGCYVSI